MATPGNTLDLPPMPPPKPGKDDCCRSGCTFCVFDLYQDELEQYRLALKAWQQRHPDQAAAAGS